MATRSRKDPPRSGTIGKPKIDTMFDRLDLSAGQAKPQKISNELVPKNFARGVSFDRLLANAMRTDAKYVADVHVTKLRVGSVRGWPGFKTSSITIDGKTPRTYQHHVVARDGLPVHKSKKIHVTCQCYRYLYFYEYALHTVGASDIIYSNGEFPVEKNPSLIKSTCKHLLAVMMRIRAEGSRLQAQSSMRDVIKKMADAKAEAQKAKVNKR